MDKWDLHLPLCEPNHNTSHMQKRFVVAHGLLIARGDATVVLDPTEKPLDFVALFVQLTVIGPWLFSPFSTRNHRFGFQRDDLSHKSVAVKALVRKHRFYGIALRWGERTVFQQRLGLRDIMALTRRYPKGQGIAQGIGDNVDFAREATATTA